MLQLWTERGTNYWWVTGLMDRRKPNLGCICLESTNIVITTTWGLPDQDLVFYLLCQEPEGEAKSLFYLERTRYMNNVEICWRENAADEKKSLECRSRLHIFGQSAAALFYRWLSNTRKSQTSISTCHLKCNRACQSWESTQIGVLVQNSLCIFIHRHLQEHLRD